MVLDNADIFLHNLPSELYPLAHRQPRPTSLPDNCKSPQRLAQGIIITQAANKARIHHKASIPALNNSIANDISLYNPAPVKTTHPRT
ncbi:uncharacterized protein QC761_108125 [Podospora bellae-mahoneyi]|uniref:Uncharacterized protein n=1 Tax=Podospora bellae-mahoneyi TaxID=2093777 RepID=A0ABR0FXI1_9PEZI|nr:hypothetical protein QC761_108125 [Podospora bellae-mahoneyi]